MSSSWECNLLCLPQRFSRPPPRPFCSISLLALLPLLFSNTPNHTVHQIKENVLLLAEEEREASTTARPTARTSLSRCRHPSRPELTGFLQPIINFSSPSNKLPTLQLVFCQWSRFAIYSTAATATSTAPRSITITPPSATTTAPACLSMDRTSPESSTPDFS